MSSGSVAFVATSGTIGSIRSDLLLVELAEGSKPLSKLYKGSDFLYPDENLASSINSCGKGKVAGIYFNAGTAYTEYKTPVIRDFLSETIAALFPDKLVEITGSHLVHVAVNELNGKMIVNLINVAGEHTNQSALGYDEVPPLQDITVSLRTPVKPSKIMLQPEGKELQVHYVNGKLTILIPELKIHAMLEVIQ